MQVDLHVEVRFVGDGLFQDVFFGLGWMLGRRDRCVDGLSTSLSSSCSGCWLLVVFQYGVFVFFGATGTFLSLELKFSGDRNANTVNSQQRLNLKWGAFPLRSARTRYTCQD